MSYKHFYLILFLNIVLASSQTFKILEDDNTQTFKILEEDNTQILLDYLTTKYNATAVLDTLDTNPVFPFHIDPDYEGRAKQLYDQIIQLKINIDDIKRKGIKESIILQAEAYLKKTQYEFDMIKEPYITKSIVNSIYPLLYHAKEAYVAIIMDYIKGDTELIDLINIIMIAIINA
jgi:hypothetical protein